MKLAQLLEAFTSMKKIENGFYLQCSNQCVNFEDKYLQESEKKCLENCNRKI